MATATSSRHTFTVRATSRSTMGTATLLSQRTRHQLARYASGAPGPGKRERLGSDALQGPGAADAPAGWFLSSRSPSREAQLSPPGTQTVSLRASWDTHGRLKIRKEGKLPLVYIESESL
ncbi:rCG23046 [Rattus norvegicus]|uniref:RCG23046 n=1 Tax=Rattus norvegicus TaxID=10116 RepID=A6KU00_RAT|nr:rCG23046 [Rattus norvegicus]